MVSLNTQQYLDLIKSLDDDREDCVEDYDTSWAPSSSYAKERMEKVKSTFQPGKTIDILNIKKDQIKQALYENTTFKIGEFIVYIRQYHGRPAAKKPNDKTGFIITDDLTVDIIINQEKLTTPSGAPCRIECKFDFFRDSRFANKSWLALFTSRGTAKNVPINTMVEIIRFLQVSQRYTSFT